MPYSLVKELLFGEKWAILVPIKKKMDPGNFKNCTKNVFKNFQKKNRKDIHENFIAGFSKKIPDPCFKQVNQILDLLKN